MVESTFVLGSVDLNNHHTTKGREDYRQCSCIAYLALGKRKCHGSIFY